MENDTREREDQTMIKHCNDEITKIYDVLISITKRLVELETTINNASRARNTSELANKFYNIKSRLALEFPSAQLENDALNYINILEKKYDELLVIVRRFHDDFYAEVDTTEILIKDMFNALKDKGFMEAIKMTAKCFNCGYEHPATMSKEGFFTLGHRFICIPCMCYWETHDHQWPTKEQRIAWMQEYSKMLTGRVDSDT